MLPTIRPAVCSDLLAINAIYNHFVLTSTCTYQEAPETEADRLAWFERHGEKHPIIVAESSGEVVGWGALSPFHGRSAYRFTVENSVYVSHTCHGREVGSALLAELVRLADFHGHHSIIAGIDSDQPISLALHRKLGFKECGRLAEVGFKFGRWLDVIYMQRLTRNPRHPHAEA